MSGSPTCVPRVQSQVDEVIDVMQENISKVIERGERLDDLQDKSGEWPQQVLMGAGTLSIFRHSIQCSCLGSSDGALIVVSITILALCQRKRSFCNLLEPVTQCESVFNRQASLMRSVQGLETAF